MHGCAWLLLYALLLSCADACGLKVGMSPGPAFGRNTSQTIFPTGWPQGSDPGLTNALTAKPKEPCFSTGFTKHHCRVGLGFRRRLCRAPLHHRRQPDEKFLSLNRWRKPSEVLLRNLNGEQGH